jgi:hypothetical protein
MVWRSLDLKKDRGALAATRRNVISLPGISESELQDAGQSASRYNQAGMVVQ